MSDYSVKNIIVAKTKNSDFLEERSKNVILKDCEILRIIPSGNYYIYTFLISHNDQRNEFNKLQDNLI